MAGSVAQLIISTHVPRDLRGTPIRRPTGITPSAWLFEQAAVDPTYSDFESSYPSTPKH